MIFHDVSPTLLKTLAGVFGLLAFLTVVFHGVKLAKGPSKLVNELIERTHSWWVMVLIASVVLFVNNYIAAVGLALLSAFALRELLNSISLRNSDSRPILWCFLTIPVQYLLVLFQVDNYYGIFIPVFVFTFLAFRSVSRGDTKDITRSLGIINWSLMITVFSFSHILMILVYPFKGFASSENAQIVLFLLLITELNDVFQFTWGKLFGKTKIIPSVSPNKTLEGFVGGFLTTAILAASLGFMVHLEPLHAGAIGALMAVVGFFGDLTFSAIKRDFQIKDLGSVIPGHGGILDRMDSLAFTGMIFFYIFKQYHG
jgi:Predicted CDP-diglyceride synthetase/phosphatidate cytidylyltransferase